MKNKILYLLISMAALTGCNDAEFLTENPRTTYTPDNIFSSSEQVNQSLTVCYAFVRDRMVMFDGTQADFAFKGGNGTDMFDMSMSNRANMFNNYSTITTSHANFKTIFLRWHEMIYRANMTIHGAQLPGVVWASENDKKYTVAQARFMRAFAYRILAELFGGLPIVTEIISAPRYDWVRSSMVETYQFCIDEMEAIVNDLPEDPNSVPAGRLVRGAAQHNLCQLYIDLGVALEAEGKSAEAQAAYSKAITWGNSVIDGGTYGLMTERFGTRKTQNPEYYYAQTVALQKPNQSYTSAGYPIKGNVYWDLFQEGNQDYQLGNRESVWALQTALPSYLGEDKRAVLKYSAFFGPSFRDNAPAHTRGTMEDLGGRGTMRVIPTMYTRDVIYEGKWADDMRNSEAVLRRTFLGNVTTSPYYGKPVPWSVFYRDGQAPDQVNTGKTNGYPVSCKIHTDKY